MISEKVDDDDNGFWLVGLKISNSRIYYEYSLHESLTFFFCFSTCLRGKKIKFWEINIPEEEGEMQDRGVWWGRDDELTTCKESCWESGNDFWRRRARRITVPETAAMAVANTMPWEDIIFEKERNKVWRRKQRKKELLFRCLFGLSLTRKQINGLV